MKKMVKIFLLLSLLVLLNPILAEEIEVSLDKAKIDLTDLPSLQRGAQLFMNYCSGCHSLQYVRYNTLAEGIGIVDKDGKVLEAIVKDDLIFSGDKISDTIKAALTKEEGAKWFGTAPPDLSLVARSRGADWLYTYLRSFYPDAKKTWGVNNRVFPDVAMPYVLANLEARYLSEKDGRQKFDAAILDLVNFLQYVGEPVQLIRQRIGLWVLLFLGVFFVFACLLKREYWKDVH
jgi:ubiquinol-cytochrome c reductase cytochrome c1 subunit